MAKKPLKAPPRQVGRHQPSNVDRLPADVREAVDALRTRQGWTIDQLVAWLGEQGHEITRSSMGRHVRSLHLDVSRAGEMLARSQSISKALMERFGDSPDNELARANIQLLHGQLFEMILGEEDAEAVEAEAGGEPVEKPQRNALEMVRLSKAIQQLLSAEKMNAERAMAIRAQAVADERERAAAAVEKVVEARGKGLSRETVDAIRFAVLGSAG